MKAKTIFITIQFGGGKAHDYPQNIPLPREGETVGFTPKGGKHMHGKVWRVWHTITEDLADIKIFIEQS